MRLQLTLLLVGLAGAARAEEPEREAGDGVVAAKVSTYADDDDTLVSTQVVDGDVALSRAVTVGGHVLVDSISSASVDVVSAATPGFEETRVEAGLRAGVSLAWLGRLTVAAVRSQENDWLSHSLQATWGRELAQKNARLELGYGYTRNDVGRADDDIFSERLVTQSLEVGASQLVDEKTLVAGAYTLQRADGYQASPYRYVTTSDGRFAFPETHPRERTRHAIQVRARRWAGGAGWELSYRLYGDDWGIVSHTIAASVDVASGRWDLRLRARGYRQDAADFWRERYDEPMTFMSVDRELSSFWDAGGGAKVGVRLGAATIDVKVDVIYYRFLDFARLAGRLAAVGDLGLRIAW